jgi:hypothetical protein
MDLGPGGLMSRSAEVILDWGGEPERAFRLALGQIRKLQEKTGCGPLGIAARCAVSIAALKCIHTGDYVSLSRLDLTQVAEKTHTREAILQGLLGAGVALPEADRLVRDWVDERPLDESLGAAVDICLAAIYGTEDEQAVGEPQAAAAASPRSRRAKSGSAKTGSTRSAAP